MRRRGLHFYGIVLFAAISCAAQTPPASAGKFRIAGTVVNANTGEIIRGALVTIGDSQNTEALASARTGGDGGFQFEGLKAAKYWMRGEAKGFVSQGFEEHQGFFTGIVTGGEVDAEHLMFALRPDAAIVGQILDETNEPLREAEVLLFRKETQQGRDATNYLSNAMVNDEGRYRFSHLAPGTYYVVVRATPWYAQGAHPRRGWLVGGDAHFTDGAPAPAQDEPQDRSLDVAYPLTYYPGATEESGATPVVLKAGDKASADMRVVAVPAVHLRMKKPGSEPGESISVNVMQKIFDGVPQAARVQNEQNEKEDVEITGLAPGDYEVRVQSFGKTQQNWTQHVSLGGGDSELVVGQASNVTVKGVVAVEGGHDASDHGFVQLQNRATGEQFNAQVSEKGEFQFAGSAIGSGSYEVDAGTTSDGRMVRLAATGAKVVGQNVEFANGATVQLAITLREGLGSVNGIVTREGKPDAGAMVVLLPQDAANNVPLIRRDQSDLDGTFSLRSVVPGKYRVLAIQHGWDLDWMNPQVMEGYLKRAELVEVRADGKYEVKVEAQ